MGKLILFKATEQSDEANGFKEYWINPEMVISVGLPSDKRKRPTTILTRDEHLFRVKGTVQSAVMRLNKATEKGVDHG